MNWIRLMRCKVFGHRWVEIGSEKYELDDIREFEIERHDFCCRCENTKITITSYRRDYAKALSEYRPANRVYH